MHLFRSRIFHSDRNHKHENVENLAAFSIFDVFRFHNKTLEGTVRSTVKYGEAPYTLLTYIKLLFSVTLAALQNMEILNLGTLIMLIIL